ncbi:hypothetical protein [Hymenobacter sp. B81]|uniref:hypothetical protein n=1 Tax=Hymenobacter sp. B81 TaxID=3344878 RepID=UPI0037DC2CF3
MVYRYLQFPNPIDKPSEPDPYWQVLFWKLIGSILSSLLPAANPDFEHLIDGVAHWYLEVDTETGIPQREIGFDRQRNPIVALPWADNCGYWTDNNMLAQYFEEHFKAQPLLQQSFEEAWQRFSKAAM